MALWEAPITPMVVSASFGMILDRSGGLRAGSRPISWMLVMGKGPVVGEEPVHSTTRSDVTVMGPGNFSSGELTLTFQLFNYTRSVGMSIQQKTTLTADQDA